jgi:hypothetical protein
MAVAFIILVWIIGAAVNTYLYYKRRCGIPISMANGNESNPGINSAVLSGMAWPIALFSEGFRHPEHCKHPAHAELWAQADAARQQSGLSKGTNSMGAFGSQKPAGTGTGQASPEIQDFMRREMDKIFGPRGPAHLVALIPNPGVAEPGRVTWTAIPSWDPAQAVADRVNAQAPPGWHARVADWDRAMPNELFIHVRDLFASGRCGDDGLAPDCSSAQLGVAIGSSWATWELKYFPKPPVPDPLDERIWQTALPLGPSPLPALFEGTRGRPAKPQGAAQVGDARSEGSSTRAVGLEPSAESDGFSEGDRVRLAKPFWGEPDPDTGTLLKDWSGPDRGDPPTYLAGSKGTIIYPNPASPEFIDQMKANGEYVVAMDDGRELYAGGPLPGVEGAVLERIPGQYQVARQNGKVYLRPRFGDGDRVRLKQSFTSQNSGKNYEAGWEGVICPLTVTMAECWKTGYYPVSVDDDPFGDVRGMINVPAEVLELIPR